MYARLKQLAELSGLFAAFFVFLGLCRMHVYYSHYHVSIISYLDFSEIILSIFSDLNAFLYTLIALPLLSFAVYAQYNSAVRPVVDLVSEMRVFSTMPQLRSFIQLGLGLGLILAPVILMFNISDWSLMNRATGYAIIALCMDVFLPVAGLAIILWAWTKRLYFTVAVSCAAGAVLYMICLGFYEIGRTDARARSERWAFAIAADTVNLRTDSLHYLVGKTNAYYFFYDARILTTEIIPSASVRRSAVQSLK